MRHNSERKNERNRSRGSLQHAHLLSGANSESKIKNFWRSLALSTKLQPWLGPILLLVALVSASAQTARVASQSDKTVMQINTGWQFREVGKTGWWRGSGAGGVGAEGVAREWVEGAGGGGKERKQQWIDKQ